MNYRDINWKIIENPYKKNDFSIGVVTLNRPDQMNAMNVRMRIDLDNLCNEISHNSELKVIIITGSGPGFCAGGDLKSEGGPIGVFGEDWEEMGISGDYKELLHYHFNDIRHKVLSKVFRKIEQMRPVTIAAVNGPAVGVGLELATGCDLRLASTNSRFGEVAVKVGFLPESGGASNLTKLVGLGKAMDMVLLGEIIDATEALSIGLVDKVVEHDKLLEFTIDYAGKIARNPYLGVIYAKKLIRMYWDNDRSDERSKSELDAVLEITRSGDCIEGAKAWLEKRRPNYRGPFYRDEK